MMHGGSIFPADLPLEDVVYSSSIRWRTGHYRDGRDLCQQTMHTNSLLQWVILLSIAARAFNKGSENQVDDKTNKTLAGQTTAQKSICMIMFMMFIIFIIMLRTIILFHHLLFPFILFHPIFIHFHPLSSSFHLFPPLSSSFIIQSTNLFWLQTSLFLSFQLYDDSPYKVVPRHWFYLTGKGHCKKYCKST